jgi:serine/threonine protein kinase
MTWNTLRHPNVLPLLGVTMDNQHFVMVSEWMANGNINEFVKAHGDTNRFELVGVSPFLPRSPLMVFLDSSKTLREDWYICTIRR